MFETTLSHRVPDYYQRIDRLLSVALWMGLAAAVGLPFLLSMPERDSYLFYALIAFDGVVGLWAYQLSGWPLGQNKYYLTIVINMMVTIGQLLILGRHGIYFFYPFILVQLISAITLMRYRFVALSLAMTALSVLVLFGLTDTFGLGYPQQYVIASVFLGSFVLVAIFLLITFRQVTLMLLAIESAKSEFIQDASHELRTPLTVIKAVNQLLQPAIQPAKKAKNKVDVHEILTHLDSATHDLEQITEKLNSSGKRKMSWPSMLPRDKEPT